MSPERLFAVDPSLTCSGWALFSLPDESLLGVGKIKSLPASNELSLRIADLQEKIALVLDDAGLKKGDLLVCEAQTTMRDPRAAFVVEQVRGVFETLAREREVLVPGRINPRSVQHEVMGLRGKQLKREIVKSTAASVVENLYGSSLTKLGFTVNAKELSKNQDIVDALLIGAYGLAKIAQSAHSGAPLEGFFSQNQKRNLPHQVGTSS